MTLGQHIKKLRLSKDLSQPALADLVGIEQSYLSKLENDKSVPSNEILRKLLRGLDISLRDLLAPLSQDYVLSELRLIPDVEQLLSAKSRSLQQSSRRWLLISSALIAVAITLFYAGHSKLLFGESLYQYRSYGVLKDGEAFDFFEWGAAHITPTAEHDALQSSLKKRYDPAIIKTYQLKGDDFIVETDEGRRRYVRGGRGTVHRVENAILQIMGVFLLCCGCLGFVLERRFYQLENGK